MSLKWYVIRTYSGHENKVKGSIDRLTRIRDLGDKVGQVHIPTIKVAEMKKGKKRIVEKKFMPGYIIAQLDLTDEDITLAIQRLPSVAGFVGSPAPESLSEEEIRNLLQSDAGEASEEAPAVARILFQVGERVKIIDGPFANFSGIVDDVMPEKARLRVKVEIFGQATPVELEYLQVASNVN